MRALVLALALSSCAAAPAMAADYSKERAACEGDARRLCSLGDLLQAGLGDPRPVARCLVANKHSISPACRAVLRTHGM